MIFALATVLSLVLIYNLPETAGANCETKAILILSLFSIVYNGTILVCKCCEGASNVVPTLYGGYSKTTYVTFLVGNGDCVKGVVALAKCLRKVKSAYPLVVAVMPDVPEDHRKALRCQGCVVHEIIEPICPSESQILIERIHSEALYSKLCVWTLKKYKKMIYLDADILVPDNIDHLFDLPTGYFYAVPLTVSVRIHGATHLSTPLGTANYA